MAVAPEQPIIIACIIAEQIWKKITILYQGPKIWNSLPVKMTYLSSLPNVKNKTARLSKIISELAKLHTLALSM